MDDSLLPETIRDIGVVQHENASSRPKERFAVFRPSDRILLLTCHPVLAATARAVAEHVTAALTTNDRASTSEAHRPTTRATTRAAILNAAGTSI